MLFMHVCALNIHIFFFLMPLQGSTNEVSGAIQLAIFSLWIIYLPPQDSRFNLIVNIQQIVNCIMTSLF